MRNMRRVALIAAFIASVVSLAACGALTSQVAEREITRIVEREVTRVVKETVIVEATPQIEVREVTRVVTATPGPEPEPAEESPSEGEGAAEPAAEERTYRVSNRTRLDVERELVPVRDAFQQDPVDAERRRAYARILYELGNVWEATEIIAPLLASESPELADLALGAKLSRITMDLAQAEQLYRRVLDLADGESDIYSEAVEGLELTWFQGNRYHNIGEFPLPEDFESYNRDFHDFLKNFEGQPYQTEWTSADRTALMPFHNDITQPGALPAMEVTVNGHPLEFILDTGGNMLVIDYSLGDTVGVNAIQSTQMKYAFTGGEYVDEAFGTVGAVELDGVVVRNVPVHLIPLQERGVEYDGIVTTQFLKQFLSTVDYERNKITLRERSESGRAQLMEEMADRGIIQVPFFMVRRHLMFAKGGINGHENMNMFMDSGLGAAQQAVVTNETAQILDLAKEHIAGTPYYIADVDSIGLAGLESTSGQVLGNIFVEEDPYWRYGFALDGLISHQYLWPLGAWTIDFDTMSYYFPAVVDSALTGQSTPQGPAAAKTVLEDTDPYVGTYEVAPGTDLIITAEDGILMLTAPGQSPIGIDAFDDGTFRIPLAGVVIEFVGSPESGITGLKMIQGAHVTNAVKKAGDAADQAAAEPVAGEGPDRGDILEELDQAIANIKGNPTSDEARLSLADVLFRAGYFRDARANLQPLADSSEAPAEALILMGDLEYLLGNYDAAEGYFQRALESAADDVQAQIMLQVKLLFVYYQANQYAKSRGLLKGFEDSIVLPTWDQMKAFDQPPYQVDWNGTEETAIPFVFTDPLPLLPVEINGQPILALIDTGGDAFVVDEEIAASLGIEPVTTVMGEGGGGLEMEVGLGRADMLRIGDVTIRNVPIMTTATQRWSGIYEGDYTLGGIITTGVLKQFLSTIDYANGQLVLRPRTEGGKQAFERELEGQVVTEVPFAMALTHMMMARGKLNDRENLTFFVDSGLADEKGAGFAAPIQTLNHVGIPLPETSVDPDDVGGLGGRFAAGSFAIEELGLGALSQKGLLGEYGSMTEDSYWNPAGFIQDGLISHNFLRQYDSWTIDFSDMVYYFAE